MQLRKVILTLPLVAATVFAAESTQERLKNAGEVFSEVMATPDRGIPQDLLEKAHCIVIVPGMKKGAFVVGAKYGRGFATCRREAGVGWGSPAGIRVEGGSFGFQIGGSSTDVVMLVMNERGMEKLNSDKFTLGGDASIAAGPIGRSAAAQTDLKLNAEILSWSRSKGVFAGLALDGATLRPDEDANRDLYGEKLKNNDILMSTRRPPAEAAALIAELNRFSRVEGSSDRMRKTTPKEHQ